MFMPGPSLAWLGLALTHNTSPKDKYKPFTEAIRLVIIIIDMDIKDDQVIGLFGFRRPGNL